jgi:hypothetical protein
MIRSAAAAIVRVLRRRLLEGSLFVRVSEGAAFTAEFFLGSLQSSSTRSSASQHVRTRISACYLLVDSVLPGKAGNPNRPFLECRDLFCPTDRRTKYYSCACDEEDVFCNALASDRTRSQPSPENPNRYPRKEGLGGGATGTVSGEIKRDVNQSPTVIWQ